MTVNLTTFNMNSKLNEAFQNPRGDVTNPNWPVIRKQSRLVLEETEELLQNAFYDKKVKVILQIEDLDEGQEAKDPVEALKQILDAQGDVTTTNDGVAHIVGFDGDECLARVYDSNMSKFITTEEEKQPALDYYYARGYSEGDLYLSGELPQMCIKTTRDLVIDGKEIPKDKFLKNMAKFQEPNFDDMVTSRPNIRVREIIVSEMVTDGELTVRRDGGGLAIINQETLTSLISQSIRSFDRQITDEKGIVESYRLVVEIDEPGLEVIEGKWITDVRFYPASPISPTITSLQRVL